MSEFDKNMFDPANFFDNWVRSMSGIWQGMEQFSLKPQTHTKSSNKNNKPFERFDKHFKSSMNAWQAFMSASSRPETVTSAYKGIGSLPDYFFKMVQPALENVSAMYRQWLEEIEKTGKVSGDFRFDHFDKDSLNIFTRLYEAEFRKFLNIPQLGIAREYQERINRFFDEFNLLQSTMAEFLAIAFQPFEKTYTSFQEKIADLAKNSELSEDPKFYYQTWLKILEKEYMELFKTPQYLTSLGKTINAVSNYKKARRDLINDMLHMFSIPSSTDIEGVYKDLHDVKKRLRNIEKTISKNIK